MHPDRRVLLRARAIALLWALGGLAPLVTIGWAVADPGPLPDLPDGLFFAPVSLGPAFVLVTLQFAPLAFVGAALASRPAAPPIGWAMLAVAAASGAAGLADRYAVHAFVLDPGSLPLGEVAAILANLLPILSHLLLGTLVLLLVPTGRLAPGLATRVLLVSAVVGLALLARALVVEGPLRGFALLENPLGVGLGPEHPLMLLPELAFHACVVASAAATWLAARDAPVQHRRLLRRVAVLSVLLSLGGGLILRFGDSVLLALPAAALIALLLNVAVFSARSHGLWAMPSLLHRSVSWLIGTTILVLVYAAIVAAAVAGSGELSTLQRLGAVAVATLIAAPAAMLSANALERRLFGASADPRMALLDLLRSLGLAGAPESAPQALADAAAQAVRQGQVRVELAGSSASAGHLPTGRTTRTALPIVHAGALVGLLAVTTPDEGGLAPAEQRTLTAMVELAAGALHAMQLAAELADGRQRRNEVVAAERGAVADVLRLELLSELEAMASELPRLDHLSPAEREEAVERFYSVCAELIERVRSVSRELEAVHRVELTAVPG